MTPGAAGYGGGMPSMVLPDIVVIGAMKCATSAVHAYLDAHPEIAMSHPKELNFFNGPEEPPSADPSTWWRHGQWHRGLEWYSRHFDPHARVRGEASPAYTSPSFPEVPERMAKVLPHARLVYLVRDPVDRALSQYAHHRRDGSERRSVAEALLDPQAQYLARSRYAERLRPHLAHRSRDQVLVLAQECLRDRPREQLRRLYEFAGVAPDWWAPELERPVHGGGQVPSCPTRVRQAFRERVADDLRELADLMGDTAPAWSAA